MKNFTVESIFNKTGYSVRVFILLLFCGVINFHSSVLLADEFRAYPTSIVFNEIEGNASGAQRSILLFTTTDGGALNWSLTKNASWINTDLTNGITPGVLKISVNTTSLMHGTYNGNVVLHSPLSTAADVVVSITLIVNPDVAVIATPWKGGYDAAMSVSIDSRPTGFDVLQSYGFKATYFTQDSPSPSYLIDYYNAGMEVGSHTINHPCVSVTDDRMRFMEIEPNVTAICTGTPEPCKDVISFAWPCGFTNYREESDAGFYFLSARGYNMNKLEDPTPDDFMNLKTYNSHEHDPVPPADLRTVIDTAVMQKKWFNMVVHTLYDGFPADIAYAATKNIWVERIGSVVKYILQRDRFILTDYTSTPSGISFSASRLAIPSTPSKNFESAFYPADVTTLQIDFDDARAIDNVYVNGVINPYTVKNKNGNLVILTDVQLLTSAAKTVEVRYVGTGIGLTISGVTASNKVYNGTTAAVLNTSGAVLVGVQSGDNVSLVTAGATGVFTNKNVGVNKTVMTSGFALTGADAGKYSLTQPSATANVTPIGVTISGVSASNKVYDGTTTATLNTGSAAIAGVLAGDNVSLSKVNAAGTFANKNIGTSKAVTITGFSLSGTDGGNYTLTQPSATASITAATLTVTGVTASSRVYNATTSAVLNTSGVSLAGVIGGDAVTLTATGVQGTFANKNTGTGKAVTGSGYSIGGADAANYLLVQPSPTADITPAPLTISGVTANNKVYNGTVAATVNGSAASLAGILAGDVVTPVFTSASGIFANKNIGTNKTVTISGITLTGTDGGNYTLTQPVSAANITQAPLTVSGVIASDKIYDGTTAVVLNTSGAVLVVIYGSDNVSLNSSNVIAAFTDKNAGSGKVVTASGFTIGGADAANYILTQPSLTATILPKTLTVKANDLNKLYKTVLTFTGNEYTYSGLVAGDALPAFTISSPGAAMAALPGQYVITITGGSLPNYSTVYVNGTLSVDKYVLTAKADDKIKVYGSDNPPLTITYTGFINGDTPSVLNAPPSISTSASQSSNPGIYGIILTGGADDLYDLKLENGSLEVDKAELRVTADNKSKVFGGANPELTLTYSGFLPGQDPGVLNVPPVVQAGVDENSDAGDYPIVVSGGSDDDYTFVYQDGTFTVEKAEQVLTFSSITGEFRMTQQVDLEASSSAGLPVSFVLSDPGKGSLNGNILTLNKDGKLTISAVQEGDHNHKAANSVAQTIDVLPTFDNISSLFTPNGDGMNDYWYIPDLEDYGNIKVSVYNRYGQKVYESDSYKNDWDGTWNGSPLPSASYYYVIKSEKKGFIKGVVNIVR